MPAAHPTRTFGAAGAGAQILAHPDEVVRAAYNLLLNREVEPVGLKHWSAALENGMSRVEFVRAVLASVEFRQQMAAVEDLTKYRDVDLIIPIRDRQFRVPASDVSLVPHLLAQRQWEPHVMRFLARELQPTHIFVDVGANIGYFSVLCAGLVHRVVAFEPVASNHRYCAANIALNGLTNVDLHHCGLWHEDATLPITVDTSSVMTAAVAEGARPSLCESIRAVSLDAMIGRGELDLPRLDILKMDIEGAELSALAGMRDTLARYRPRIVMEVNRPALAGCGATVDEVWDYFQAQAYELRAFEHWKERDPDPVETLEDLKRLCPDDSLVDVLAVPR